ncbi:3-hydroxyacyl-[acyl-carrier-protein] dehydratase [Streptomyces griseochromogenes]|uniref:3-hydroxyacyl-[acyl-carrier-protein] dehydratase n=1 Tax=Streptomyces griseochromogenes TaxID=68214 RepID=A0A1B1B0A1_9ACTN|nr:3-hydroxyacyl-ACP dehydratase FabZ [Streptomyces griseochromogenes]ANP52256.1 beta-hydroxyacyl-ACP dehydratase [Streptomyces griseochromogenes]MBP2055638.1 3-hydroxyacyl-[acyl-carrier-protein] dehydratase [Streptomyces griseochromogenes]
MTGQPSSTPARAVLTADDIARLLPHRHPFFLLDRITDLAPGVSAEAIKNITASDGVLAGHFPGRMLYPGVLLVECVAQLAAVIYGSAAAQSSTGELVADVADRVGYLAEIRQAKFMKPVFPGDQVVFRAHSGSRLGGLISVTGQASVGRELVMTARLAVTELEQP